MKMNTNRIKFTVAFEFSGSLIRYYSSQWFWLWIQIYEWCCFLSFVSYNVHLLDLPISSDEEKFSNLDFLNVGGL